TANSGTVSGQAPPIVETNTPPTQYLVTASAVVVPAGESVTILAQLAGATGDPVAAANQVVTWSSTGGGTFATSSSVTNSSGVARVVFTTSSTPGTNHVVTASTGSLAGHTSGVATVGGTAGAPVR